MLTSDMASELLNISVFFNWTAGVMRRIVFGKEYHDSLGVMYTYFCKVNDRDPKWVYVNSTPEGGITFTIPKEEYDTMLKYYHLSDAEAAVIAANSDAEQSFYFPFKVD